MSAVVWPSALTTAVILTEDTSAIAEEAIICLEMVVPALVCCTLSFES